VLLCCAWLCVAALPAAAAPDLTGRWILNEDGSDDAHERLQGLTVLRARPKPTTEAERDRTSRRMSRQARVYDEMQLAKERRLIKQEADVGTLARVLNAEVLAVSTVEGGYAIDYDGAFTRALKPRPGGPRYSAKGDEFQPDEIGRSMVFWRTDTLVIETLLAPRGTMHEEISLGGGRLKIHTIIRNPDWLFEADILRVFDRAP